MSFRHNLQHLRASRHMTQEQLAMLLGVSRQSVTKWEAERAHPEMDKLIQICAIFNCTIDELVTGDLTNRPIALCESMNPRIVQDIYGYDEHMHEFARMIALGISSVLGSIAVALMIIGTYRTNGTLSIQEEAVVLALFLSGIAIGTACVVPAFSSMASFMHMHPYIHDFYTEAQKQDAKRESGKAAALASVLAALGLLAPMAMKGTAVEPLADGIMMILITTAAWLIAYFGLLGGRVDIDAYNREALCSVSPERLMHGEKDQNRRRILLANRSACLKANAFRSGVMTIATLASLVLLFAPIGLESSDAMLKFFWLPWALGLALCSITGGLLDAIIKKE